MTRKTVVFICTVATLGFLGFMPLKAGGPSTSRNFSVADVHFEQNATDGDVEVVFSVKGGDEGLEKLTVVSPDGRTVIDFAAPESTTLGIRQFRFESPEPGDVESLQSAYPEGAYTFSGSTSSGDKFEGTSTLSHKLPATTGFLSPSEDAEDVDVNGLEITWTPVKNMAAYIVYIERSNPDLSLTAKLPGSAAKFSVPDGFLLPGLEYQLGIGTEAEDGNTSFIETSFSTAGENSLNK